MATISLEQRSIITVLMLGAALVGTLDILFATSFWAIRGVSPVRILQSVAAGVQGSNAYRGGNSSALLGLGLHFFIAACMVLAFYLASRQWPVLVRSPLLAGSAYGVVLYIVMNRVVVPLSAVPPPRPEPIDWPWVLSSIVVHIVFVGLPSAFVARHLQSIAAR
jgi:uncharacterized membrane protein YagU involved in acid resistance